MMRFGLGKKPILFARQLRNTSSFLSKAAQFSRNSRGNKFSFQFTALIGIVAFSSSCLFTTHCDNGTHTNNDPKWIAGTDPSDGLFPSLRPFDSGFLKVSELHTVAYWQFGNPLGKPVLFIHGGPGSGTNFKHARYFNPNCYRIILVDQRGCGQSSPLGCLQENTTYDLIEDFEKIREKLKISKWQIFGGSWGSTLGLAYTIKYPHRVTEMILRGIFLGRKEEVEWTFEKKNGRGAFLFFPEDWEKFHEAIPEDESDAEGHMQPYRRRLFGELGNEEMMKAADAWSNWEGRLMKLVPSEAEKPSPLPSIPQSVASSAAIAGASLENHYSMNHFFFPTDNYLLEKDNIDRIKHIPTVIVQGRYDMCCPPISAYELYKALGGSNGKAEIHFVIAGHSAGEKETILQLVAATEKFKDAGF